MFNNAVIHFPTDENTLIEINKELAAFRCSAAVKHIESLQLSDSQIEALYAIISEEISQRT